MPDDHLLVEYGHPLRRDHGGEEVEEILEIIVVLVVHLAPTQQDDQIINTGTC